MSAITDQETNEIEAAPPPPWTVVWSMFSWPELLSDNSWLEAYWVPMAGGMVNERSLPDAQRGALQGHTNNPKAAKQLAMDNRPPSSPTVVRYFPLYSYMIR